MKTKNIFSFENIRNIIVIAAVLFFILPLLAPEEKTISVIKKERITDREESPLPIFPRENVFERYEKRLKKFYHLDKAEQNRHKTPAETVEEIEEAAATFEEERPVMSAKNTGNYTEDLFFSEDYIGEDTLFNAEQNHAAQQVDNTVNLQAGTVLTSDNLLLEPTQQGYYHKGVFYKNGTYPKGANKQAIEGALNRYHSKVAKQLRKKAVYFADDKGNLTVDYVDKLPNEVAQDIDTYRANQSAQNNTLYAKASKSNNTSNKYRGAHINGLNQRSADTPVNSSYSDIARASLYDMHAAYNLTTHKIKNGEIGNDININPSVDTEDPAVQTVFDNPNIAQPMIKPDQIAEIQEKICKEGECNESLRVAPKIKNEDLSNLYGFYHSFCTDQCPAHEQILQDNFRTREGEAALRNEIRNNDQTIVELNFLSENPEYLQLVDDLQSRNFRNKNGQDVTFRLRERGEPAPEGSSFGEKMIHPFKQNMLRDFQDQNDPNETIQQIVNRYDEIDTKFRERTDNDATIRTFRTMSNEAVGMDDRDIQVALVERINENTYMVNNAFIPDGYKTEIKEWQQYRHTTPNGSPFYVVPKQDLVNVSNNTAVILIGEDTGKDLKFESRSSFSVKVIPQKQIYSYEYQDVENTENTILNAKVDLLREKVFRVGEIIDPMEPIQADHITQMEKIPELQYRRFFDLGEEN